jgi:hypothetical protein
MDLFDFEDFWSQQNAQARLCMATSAGLLLTAGLGIAINLFAPRLIPLELLSCAGILYALMALANVSWRRRPQPQVLRSARWSGRHAHDLTSAPRTGGTRPRA